jgi:hypothetical protein
MNPLNACSERLVDLVNRVRPVECDHTLGHSLTFFRSCLRSMFDTNFGRSERMIMKVKRPLASYIAAWIGTPRIDFTAVGFHTLGPRRISSFPRVL